MAVKSDSMYNATGSSCFMPANVYYGFVERCRNANRVNTVVFGNDGISRAPAFDRCTYDTAMETEEYGYDYTAAINCSNGDSTIREASLASRLQGNDTIVRCRQKISEDADASQRRNRKRCNNDHSCASQLKKFRKGNGFPFRGGGMDYVCSTMENAKDYGFHTTPCEFKPLHIDSFNNDMERSVATNRNYCWLTGNQGLLNDSGSKESWCHGKQVTLAENNMEYEKILFETHGCSVYQLHRLELAGNDCGEAEF